jgi:hypothetical protein
VHAAELLHQVEGTEIPEGGWVGGDAWFGSVLSAVKDMVRFNVFSTWVIKQKTDFFPMHAFHSVLTARYSKRPAGHWIVFQTTISGVMVLAVCSTWSHSSTTYFVSTCGSTNPAKLSYITHFKDEFGTVGVKHIPQPSIKEWFYNFVPLIDEHNKQAAPMVQPTVNPTFNMSLVSCSAGYVKKIFIGCLWRPMSKRPTTPRRHHRPHQFSEERRSSCIRQLIPDALLLLFLMLNNTTSNILFAISVASIMHPRATRNRPLISFAPSGFYIYPNNINSPGVTKPLLKAVFSEKKCHITVQAIC